MNDSVPPRVRVTVELIRNALIAAGCSVIALAILGSANPFRSFAEWGAAMPVGEVKEILSSVGSTIVWLAVVYWVLRPAVLFGIEMARWKLGVNPPAVPSPPAAQSLPTAIPLPPNRDSRPASVAASASPWRPPAGNS